MLHGWKSHGQIWPVLEKSTSEIVRDPTNQTSNLAVLLYFGSVLSVKHHHWSESNKHFCQLKPHTKQIQTKPPIIYIIPNHSWLNRCPFLVQSSWSLAMPCLHRVFPWFRHGLLLGRPLFVAERHVGEHRLRGVPGGGWLKDGSFGVWWQGNGGMIMIQTYPDHSTEFCKDKHPLAPY